MGADSELPNKLPRVDRYGKALNTDRYSQGSFHDSKTPRPWDSDVHMDGRQWPGSGEYVCFPRRPAPDNAAHQTGPTRHVPSASGFNSSSDRFNMKPCGVGRSFDDGYKSSYQTVLSELPYLPPS